MKLIIAEKPDQGAKLAAPFSHKKRTGYIEIERNEFFPAGAVMTWAIGHLCELAPPEHYHEKWKKWSMEMLPMIPPKFQYRVMKSKWKQFNIIKKFIASNEISEIIIASDAGREGEAIVRIILALCNNRHPAKRLWISSLTPKSVRHGFQHLLDERETRNIYDEALSRSCADWLVGMNASRAYTLLLKQKGIADVFSTGRVQTPTLALIVKRENEIEQFQPEPFWEVKATFQMNGKTFIGIWHKEKQTRIKTKELAEKISVFCRDKQATIAAVEKERKEVNPPFFFNLSSLQATANKRYKFSPQITLDIAQKLYVKGIISYPRSDSNFITAEEAKMFPDILEKISQQEEYQSFFPLPVSSIANNKRYVNEKKVSDHYAIIPTEQVPPPSRLSEEEAKIYSLIVERLLAAHDQKAVFDYTTAHTLVDQRATFITKGREVVQEGWRRIIYPQEKNSGESDKEQHLPTLLEGEEGVVQRMEIKEGKTQPPKRYTEGDLITLMKTAGKHLGDEHLTQVLQQTEGLGTEATRAGIIGVLKQRKYISVSKNQVHATDKGKLLIEAVGASILASPEMTAKWEQRLRQIGEGKSSAEAFMEQAKKLARKLVEDAAAQSANWRFDHLDLETIQVGAAAGKRRRTTILGKCKKCGGNIVDKGSIYGCTNYKKTKCTFTISKKILGKSISTASVKKLLSDGQTNLIKGFQKGDKTFAAYLIWNDSTTSVQFKYKETNRIRHDRNGSETEKRKNKMIIGKKNV
ncbi:DNA topoisomerase-3 [Evansella caseinilytica]|uniref:DNA topoisomerase n=1 Tax=Evansella caseinilytica TaxID=1503961 RepID=A0A1H3NWI3_9BACI|nr:DNA topoisomerase III [Evansella caseinilytica]SDY93257.1 DNA topoisomerase-3 [Evansella caseinilytica]